MLYRGCKRHLFPQKAQEFPMLYSVATVCGRARTAVGILGQRLAMRVPDPDRGPRTCQVARIDPWVATWPAGISFTWIFGV